MTKLERTSREQQSKPTKPSKQPRKQEKRDISHTNIVRLFAHLSPQYDKWYKEVEEAECVGLASKEIHPSILKVAVKFADRSLRGSNARCIAMLEALKDAVSDFELFQGSMASMKSSSVVFAWSSQFESYQKKLIQYLVQFRPISVSMGSAINFVKKKLTETMGMPALESKQFLIKSIDTFIDERIVVADQLISDFGNNKINDGDVLLTYGSSSVVEQAIVKAYQSGKKFQVIVVDSRPMLEGLHKKWFMQAQKKLFT